MAAKQRHEIDTKQRRKKNNLTY